MMWDNELYILEKLWKSEIQSFIIFPMPQELP